MNNKNHIYLLHLLSSINYHKQNTLSQKGKSDIETLGYESSVALWFEQLYECVQEHPPEYFVNAINVYEINQKIEKIEYDYFPQLKDTTNVKNAIINLSKNI